MRTVLGTFRSLFFFVMFVASAHAQNALSTYDTGTPQSNVLTSKDLLEKPNWQLLSPGGSSSSFKGAAVLINEQIAIVARPGAVGFELYGMNAGVWTHRSTVSPVLEKSDLRVASIQLVNLEKGVVSVEMVFRGATNAQTTLRVELEKASPIAKTKAGSGTMALRTSSPSRLGVLPDFFADDAVIDARTIPVDNVEIPSENFFMQMLGQGDAIVTSIWDKNERDMEISLSGSGESRVITSADVPLGKDGINWIAVLEGPGIWGQGEVTLDSAKQVTPLNWKVPFPAKWKGDFVRADHTVDSWDFIDISTAVRGNRSPRWRWSGVVGAYDWPCWFDKSDKGLAAFIQPATKFPNGKFTGPFLAYPVDRAADTPVNQLTITDLMRNSLGIGPCQYIMDVAGQGVQNKGIFTCAVDTMIPQIFKAGRQKEELVLIDHMMTEVVVFIKAIGDRINSYVEFRQNMLTYLADQKAAHPKLEVFLGRLEAQTKSIHSSKVDNVPAATKLANRVRAEAAADVPSVKAIHQLTNDGGGLASIGLWQDNTVARCRNVVKILRQIATIEQAVNPDPATVAVAREIRARTQKVLREALGHEMR